MNPAYPETERRLFDVAHAVLTPEGAADLQKVVRTFVRQDGSIEMVRLEKFVYSRFDRQREVLSRVPDYIQEIKELLKSDNFNYVKLALAVSRDPSLSEIMVKFAQAGRRLRKNVLEDALSKLGKKKTEKILEEYSLLSNYPDDNIFHLNKKGFLHLSVYSANVAVMLAKLLFDEEGVKKIQELANISPEPGEEFSIFSSLFFITLLRYVGVGLVHRITQEILTKYRKRLGELEDAVMKAIPDRRPQRPALQAIRVYEDTVTELITEKAASMDLVRISSEYLEGTHNYKPSEIYLLDAGLMDRRKVEPAEYPIIFNAVLNYALHSHYSEKMLLERVNIHREDTMVYFKLLEKDLFSQEGIDRINSFDPRTYE